MMVHWRDRQVICEDSKSQVQGCIVRHNQSFTSKNAGQWFLEQKTRLYPWISEQNEWGN